MLPILVLVMIYFSAAIPNFAGAANLENMARVFAPLLVAAIGATFILLLGGIDLSVGAVMSLSSIVGAMVMRDTGSVGLGVLCGVLVGVAVGLINGLAVAWLRLTPFVHTLAMLLIVRAVAFLLSRGYSVGQLPPLAMDIGRSSVIGLPTLFLIAIAIFVAALWVQRLTHFGRHLYLIGTNERAAIFSGIPVRRVKLVAYLIGGTLGAIAGQLAVLRLGSGAPVLGDNILLLVIAAVVVGGTSVFGGEGGLLRTLTGCALIAILDKGLNLMGLSFYDQAIVVGLVILFGSALGTWIRNRKLSERSQVGRAWSEKPALTGSLVVERASSQSRDHGSTGNTPPFG